MRPIQIRSVVTLCAVVGVCLACAGIWRDVHRESFSELSVRLAAEPALDEARRAEVQTLLDDGWIAAHEGEMSFMTAVNFDVEFDDALEDGSLSAFDVVSLTEAAASFASPEITPERRAELLALKSDLDDEQRAALGLPEPSAHDEPVEAGTTDLDTWRIPTALQQRLERLGWSDVVCTDDGRPTPSFGQCDGRAGTQAVRVTIERDAESAPDAQGGVVSRLSGRTWLSVELSDGRAAEVLRDAVMPTDQRLSGLTTASLSTSLERQGLIVQSCTSERGRFLTCEADRDLVQATVLLDLSPTTSASDLSTRVTSEAGAVLTQGADLLTVRVLDAAAGAALVDALLQ